MMHLHTLRRATAVAVLLLAFASGALAQVGQREILEGREYYFGIPHCDI